MVKSLRLSGKFNPEEAEIIKKFQKDPIVDPELEVDTRLFSKYEEKLSDNKLVRWAIFSLIVSKEGVEVLHLLEQHDPEHDPEFDLDKLVQFLHQKRDTMLKKKKAGRRRIIRKRGRPRT